VVAAPAKPTSGIYEEVDAFYSRETGGWLALQKPELEDGQNQKKTPIKSENEKLNYAVFFKAYQFLFPLIFIDIHSAQITMMQSCCFLNRM
jgi:hypothetical protein